MPEESLETGELQEKLAEALEKAEEAGEERASPKWLLFLSLSTGIIAVLAAIASLEAGSLANDALLAKNEAVLTQAKASDQWAYFQAKGIKATIYLTQADAAAGRNVPLGKKFSNEAARYKSEQDEIKSKADELQKTVDENNEKAAKYLEVHHHFALAVTFFQVAIALGAIAALTRRKFLWFVGLGIAGGGLLFFIRGIF